VTEDIGYQLVPVLGPAGPYRGILLGESNQQAEPVETFFADPGIRLDECQEAIRAFEEDAPANGCEVNVLNTSIPSCNDQDT
jgi:hypothetical protein